MVTKWDLTRKMEQNWKKTKPFFTFDGRRARLLKERLYKLLDLLIFKPY